MRWSVVRVGGDGGFVTDARFIGLARLLREIPKVDERGRTTWIAHERRLKIITCAGAISGEHFAHAALGQGCGSERRIQRGFSEMRSRLVEAPLFERAHAVGKGGAYLHA